ncbi:MAG: diguanylate cyclase [Rhizobacter sp.]|nr:diguanylate cyclase [Rhizobacter sp.]
MNPGQPLPPQRAAHLRLQAWGPFIVVGMLMALLWGVVLVYAVVQERRFVEGGQRQLRLINTAVVQHTRGLLQAAESDLDVLQHWLGHSPAGTDVHEDAALAELMSRLSERSGGLLHFALVDAAGRAMPSVGTPAPLLAMPPVPPPAQVDTLQLGDPLRSAATAPWHWPLSRRLPTPAGEVAGLVAWVDLTRLSALHEALREKPAGAISLITPTGVLVVRTPYTEGLIGRNLLGNRPPPAVASSGPQGMFRHDGALTGGQPRMATYERLVPYPVSVVVSQEYDEILAAFHQRLKVGIAVLLLLTVGSVFFSVLLARSQRATRRSQAQFDALSNAFPLGLFLTDTHGVTTHANDTYLQKFGVAPEQLAWGWSERFDEPERSALLAEWRDAVSEGRPIRKVLSVRRPGGGVAMLSVRSAPLRVDGKLVGQVGCVDDITERVQQQRAQRMLTAIFERSTDIVAQVSAQGQMLYLNPAGRELLALQPGDPIRHLRYDDFQPAHRETQVRDVIMPTALATGIWVGETSVLCGDGREIDVSEMLIVHRDENQKVETYSVVMRDITQELHARTELQRSESVLRIVAATLPVLVAVADKSQHYLFTNDAFDRWVGRPQGRLAGRHAREVLGEAEYARRRPYIEAAMAGQRVMFESTYDGNQYFETTYIPFRNADGEVAGLVALSQDVTTHKRQHQKLLDASQTDALTGALNRVGFDLRVGEALARTRDGGPPLALLFVDLDRFKPVNDEHGHATGDALLEAVAHRLQTVLRPSDMLARLGGDEFAVVLPDVKDDRAAGTVARKIVSTLGEPFEIEGKTLCIGASVGLALARHGQDTVQSLTQRADVALYRAKRAGRGRFEVAENSA